MTKTSLPKLTCVTFTGADDNTDIDAMIALSKRYPQIEWGILFSTKHQGTPRYPSMWWVDDILDATTGTAVRLSAHLCGGFVRAFVAKPDTPSQMTTFHKMLATSFCRVQLNVTGILDHTDPSCYDVRCAIQRVAPMRVITQFKAGNLTLTDYLINLQNHEILFDESGGTGTLPHAWKPPFATTRCGYAGGLSPDNIASHIGDIRTAARKAPDIWIDMETGVRTDDAFDLEKVTRVMAILTEMGAL